MGWGSRVAQRHAPFGQAHSHPRPKVGNLAAFIGRYRAAPEIARDWAGIRGMGELDCVGNWLATRDWGLETAKSRTGASLAVFMVGDPLCVVCWAFLVQQFPHTWTYDVLTPSDGFRPRFANEIEPTRPPQQEERAAYARRARLSG